MKQLLLAREVAAMLGVSRSTVWLWTKNGNLPQPVVLGPRCTRWRLADIQTVIDGTREAASCDAA